MCKLLNVRGRFKIATASVTAICHQNATSKFLGIDFVRKFGGERGIRTLEGLLTLTPLAGVRLRPLGHLSAPGNAGVSAHWPAAARLPACGAAMILKRLACSKALEPARASGGEPCAHERLHRLEGRSEERRVGEKARSRWWPD